MRQEYSNAARMLYTKELVFQIVFLIINRSDYKEASRIMIDNSISIEELTQNTLKLNSKHIALLTDEILK